MWDDDHEQYVDNTWALAELLDEIERTTTPISTPPATSLWPSSASVSSRSTPAKPRPSATPRGRPCA